MTDSPLPKVDPFKQHLQRRQRVGRVWGRVFYLCNFVAILTLIALFFNIINNAFGYVATSYQRAPSTLSDTPLETLDKAGLAAILQKEAPKKLRVLIRDTLSRVSKEEFSKLPLSAVLNGSVLTPDVANLKVSEISDDQAVKILIDNMDQVGLYNAVMSQIVEPTILQSWPLFESLTQRDTIAAQIKENYPDAEMVFRSWVNSTFLQNTVSSYAISAGLRTALIGTLLVITITSLFAFPLGIGSALYLEEYASDNWLNRLIETNIRNLAGVPSIIYGMLGLTVFVRLLAPITSGAIFGVTDTDGRTILSAGLTLGLVILPVIIISAQEAIRAVPPSIREASYGLGATKLQTIVRTVLPTAMPGILTGIILSLSRAIGETAPLIVVGASTFITIDPNGPFSKFTVVPIQIFQWTSKPQQEFRNTAAAAIVVLMVVLVILNSFAIMLRNRYTRRLGS